MKIIERDIDGGMFDSAIFSEYFGGFDVAVVDIETTALSPARGAVILGGIISGRGGHRLAVQFFAETIDDEPELLKRFTDTFADYDVIVTYNGNKFDIPFLRRRMEYYDMDTCLLDRIYYIDMYRVLKKHSHLPKILPDMKQKTVEAYLGDADLREDKIDGKKSIELYYEYVKSTGCERGELLEQILLHNRDDIVRLSDMMRILKSLDMHEIMYSCGFPVGMGDKVIIVDEIKVGEKRLTINGRVMPVKKSPLWRVSDYVCYEDFYTLEVKAIGRRLRLEVDCETADNFTYTDLKLLDIDVPKLAGLGGYESGYLILKEGKKVRYAEVNKLVRWLLYRTLQ